MVNDIQYLQGTATVAATANGNGQPINTAGYVGALQVEIIESGGGSATATVTLEGAFDGNAASTWYALGYYRVDGQAALTRAATGIPVTASTSRVYQILDPYPNIRARISAVANSAAITARVYRVGV